MENRVRLLHSWREKVRPEGQKCSLSNTIFSQNHSLLGTSWTRVHMSHENPFSRVSKSHAGHYRCRADNGLEPAIDADFQLLVQGMLFILSSSSMILFYPPLRPLCELQSKWGALAIVPFSVLYFLLTRAVWWWFSSLFHAFCWFSTSSPVFAVSRKVSKLSNSYMKLYHSSCSSNHQVRLHSWSEDQWRSISHMFHQIRLSSLSISVDQGWSSCFNWWNY